MQFWALLFLIKLKKFNHWEGVGAQIWKQRISEDMIGSTLFIVETLLDTINVDTID